MLARPQRSAAILLAVLCLIGVAPALRAADDPVPRGVAYPAQRFVLHHQPAREAIEPVRMLLSVNGSVELQGADTLVVRDQDEVRSKVEKLLRDFDHPPRVLRIVIQVVRAGTARVSPPPPSQLPAELLQRLRQLLRYDQYELLGTAGIEAREGTRVNYDLADGGFAVGYRMGTVIGRRLRLYNFRLARSASPERALIDSTLNIWLDQTMALGLARDESSPDALMVVLTCSEAPNGGAARPR
ncbi:MAG: hypothetical protein ACM3OB_07265 [Acidobacteriota bacterium]